MILRLLSFTNHCSGCSERSKVLLVANPKCLWRISDANNSYFTTMAVWTCT